MLSPGLSLAIIVCSFLAVPSSAFFTPAHPSLSATLSPARGLTHRVARAVQLLGASYEDEEVELLLLCAKTDRGQRAGAEERARAEYLISALEEKAPPADVLDLNGSWRLLYASEAPYRSSPFFSAFRQVSQALTTPVAVPSSNVAAGQPIASAIFAITDAIPFYDVGACVQTITGVCSEDIGCAFDESAPPPGAASNEPSDGASNEDEPSDGTSDQSLGPSEPTLTSRVDLAITRLFGLPVMSSVMTTVSSVATVPAPDGEGAALAPGTVEVDLTVQTTQAAQSAIEELVPQLGSLLGPFPSGDALEAIRKGSSTVKLRTTYLTSHLRVSRPVIDLDGTLDDSAVFVYSREE